MGQGIQDRTTYNMWKTAFKKCEVIWSALASVSGKKIMFFFSVISRTIHLNFIKIEFHYKGVLGNISKICLEASNHSFFGARLKSYFNEFLGINPEITLGHILSL